MTDRSPVLAGGQSGVVAIVRALRPRQWVKNLLVLAGPLASGLFLTDGVLLRSVFAAAGFCLLSSAVYLVNDVLDVERDRGHPTKSARPIAAGLVSARTAVVLAAVLTLAGAALCAVSGVGVLLVAICYVVLGMAYSLGLKQVPVLDLLLVAGGFALRGLAGVFAVPTQPTVWFVLLTIFGSLLLVAGKRSSEKSRVGDDVSTREILAHYSDSYLQFVREFSAAGLLMAYGLMAFDKAQSTTGVAEFCLQVSIVPFLAGVMLVVKRLDDGEGETPEDLLLRDRAVQGVALLWGLTFALGVYL